MRRDRRLRGLRRADLVPAAAGPAGHDAVHRLQGAERAGRAGDRAGRAAPAASRELSDGGEGEIKAPGRGVSTGGGGSTSSDYSPDGCRRRLVAGQSLPRRGFRYSVPRVPVNDGRQPISHHRAGRRRRHGRGVPRRRGIDARVQEERRHQAHPPGAHQEQEVRRDVPGRGAAVAVAAAREHRPGVRHRARRRHVLHRHGVRRRRRPQGAARVAPAHQPPRPDRARPLHDPGDLQGPRLRARAHNPETGGRWGSSTATSRRPTC